MQNNDTLIGERIDGYQIDDLLGHGGMGRVYRGLDIKLKRYAALKVMNKPSSKAEVYEKRFFREAQAIAKLKHPNIVAIYRFNDVNDVYYMAMEYVDGADLRWVLRDYSGNGELIDYNTLLKIMEQISSALDYAHQNGVIHRDIKPSNIMISRKGDAILTDFGLALDVQEGTGGEIFGSPHYIAPEQAVSSAQAVPQTDFYALGVILFEMLTGSVPFDIGSALQVAMAHIGDPLPDPKSINPDLHDAFVPVLEKILEKEPANRYQNGKQFIIALKQAIRDATRSNSSVAVSTLGRPADRIMKNITPLPEPGKSVDTKPATRFAPESRLDSKEPATKVLEDNVGKQAEKPRRKRRPIFVFVSAIILAIIIGAYFLRDELLYQFQTNFAAGDSSEVVNIMIEGIVSDVISGRNYVTLTVNGFDVQVEREHPLYDEVAVDDEVRIEGRYAEVNEDLRFSYIARAELNDTPVIIEEESE